MADRHKHKPIPFRPTGEGDRSWLMTYAERTGKAVNAILSAALSEFRGRHENGEISPPASSGSPPDNPSGGRTRRP